MRSWLTALRIARREARRAKGRSALIVAMIALPVLCLSFAAVTYDMFRLTPQEQQDRQLGAADARVRWEYDGPAAQDFAGEIYMPIDRSRKRESASREELLAALPPGSRMTPTMDGAVTLRTPGGVAGVSTHEFDLGNPLLAGLVKLVSGRPPATDDEVAVTEQGLDRVGTSVGGTIELGDRSHRYTVTAAVEFPDRLGPAVVFRPGAAPPGSSFSGGPFGGWLVDTPGPIGWAQVRELNKKGIVVESRELALNPPPDSENYPELAQFDSGPNLQELAYGVLIAGLGILEVVLLAGPAFTVGARRRQRQLALVAANGGTPAHIRRIVLADGIVLGLVAAGIGVLLGIAVAVAGRPLVETYLAQSRAGGYRFFPLALLGVAGIAVLTGVLGALVPAFVAARQDVVASLSGLRGVTRSRKRWIVVGLAGCAFGILIAGYGAMKSSINVLLGGLVVGELGIVLCTPALVGLVARLGRFLPLAPRIALRDAARNRAAAAPAISAVMAAVAGTMAIGVYLLSSSQQQVQSYGSTLPLGTVVAYSTATDGQPSTDAPVPAAELTAAVRESVPVGSLAEVYDLHCTGDYAKCPHVVGIRPQPNECPFLTVDHQLSRDEQVAARADRRCDMPGGYRGTFETIVDDGTALPILTGAPADQIAQATAVLRAGGVVVGDDLLVMDGKVTVVRAPNDPDDGEPERRITVPGYAITSAAAIIPNPILSPAAAEQLGLTPQWAGVVVTPSRALTTAEEDHLRAAAADHGSSVLIERGPPTGEDPTLLVLAIAAAVITLGAAGIATGLAAADGRADLSTLAAVGASPRLRRILSLSQAGVIAGLGALLGGAAGLGTATAVLFAMNQVHASEWPANVPYPILVPWSSLAVVVLVVPLVAMLGAGMLTRSRLPIERRLAT